MSNNLSLVILYDARNNAYTVCDHNLTSEEADNMVAMWKEQLLNAIKVDQRAAHRTTDPQDCRACRRDVARASGLEPKPRFQRRKTA